MKHHRFLTLTLAMAWVSPVCGEDQQNQRSLSDLTGPWQLLIDDYLIAHKGNLVRSFHSLRKSADNPLPSGEVPGTRTVLHQPNGAGYRTWYKGYLYTSPGGIQWRRAERMVYGRARKGSIVHTPWDTGREYKLFSYGYTLWRTLKPKDPLIKGGFRYGSYSTDGIRWKDLDEPLFADRTDVANFCWDPHEQRFLATPKIYTNVRGISRRCVGFSSSRRFQSGWPTAELLLVPDIFDDRWVTRPDQRTEFYSLCVFPYETIYLGLLEVFRVTDGVNDGPKFVELVSSRDGLRWKRTPRNGDPILPNGPAGAWDAGMISARSHPLREGDTIKLFYYGRDQEHGFGRGYHETRGMDHLINRGSGIATIRKDGFASLDAGDAVGTLTTKPLSNAEGVLAVNYATGSAGWLKVELRDTEHQVIPGYRVDQCQPLRGDSVNQQVRWAGQAQLPGDGRPVRLRFVMRNASLYSFRAGQNVAVDSREPALAALYTFEDNGTAASQDKLTSDGAQWLHLDRQVTIVQQGGRAAFGQRAACFSGDATEPRNTLEIGDTFRLGRHFTLAAMVQPAELDRARLFSAWEPFPKRTNEAPFRRLEAINHTGEWVGNKELIFDFDPSGKAGNACLRLIVHGHAVSAGGVFADRAYHHLAATYDDGAVKLFLDGAQIGSGTVPGGRVPLLTNLRLGEDPGPFTINSAGQNRDEQLKGCVDDVLVVGRVLTEGQIRTLASKGAESLFADRKH